MRITRTALELFGLTLHWYGVLIALGVGLAIALAWARESRVGVPKETSLNLALICVPAAVVGARLYYVAFSWPYYAARPLEIFKIWNGGMAIYGGVIAGVLAGWIYARVKKLPFRRLMDLAAPAIPLGQAIGRWGNFVNQEAHGAPVKHAALQFFPMAVQIDGVWCYATFFYESAWCFLIVAALLKAERRGSMRREGDLFLWYALLYALERAVVEGMRTDSLMIGPLRASQALSLLVAAAIAVCWAVRARRVPAALRIAAPAAVIGMWGIAASESTLMTLGWAAIALALAAAMYFYRGKDQRSETEAINL